MLSAQQQQAFSQFNTPYVVFVVPQQLGQQLGATSLTAPNQPDASTPSSSSSAFASIEEQRKNLLALLAAQQQQQLQQPISPALSGASEKRKFDQLAGAAGLPPAAPTPSANAAPQKAAKIKWRTQKQWDAPFTSVQPAVAARPAKPPKMAKWRSAMSLEREDYEAKQRPSNSILGPSPDGPKRWASTLVFDERQHAELLRLQMLNATAAKQQQQLLLQRRSQQAVPQKDDAMQQTGAAEVLSLMAAGWGDRSKAVPAAEVGSSVGTLSDTDDNHSEAQSEEAEDRMGPSGALQRLAARTPSSTFQHV